MEEKELAEVLLNSIKSAVQTLDRMDLSNLTHEQGTEMLELGLALKYPASYVGYTVQKEPAYQELSTKEFFRVSDEDRLYWWRKDGDIELTEEIQSWLKRMQERYSELWKQPIPGETGEWQRRFVSLLSRHPDVECFELLFFEFMGNFNSVMFRAAVLLLEEVAGEQAEYRRLIAVMANKKLRYEIFSF
jgi:hypothetical protein